MSKVRTRGLITLLGTVVVLLLALFIPASAFAFTDVLPGSQFSEAISDLSALKIINGFSVTTFGPAQPVTRQQFAKMIVLTLRIPVSESVSWPFTDVPRKLGELYPYHYVAAAANSHITNGVTATLFKPNDKITRAQVISMVVRAVDALHPGTLAAPGANFVSSWGNFPTEHATNAAIAEANGLLAGVAPAGATLFMPRGEVAQVLDNVLDLLNGTTGPPVEPPVTPPVEPPVTPPQPPVTPPEPPQPPEPPIFPPQPPPMPPPPPSVG